MEVYDLGWFCCARPFGEPLDELRVAPPAVVDPNRGVDQNDGSGVLCGQCVNRADVPVLASIARRPWRVSIQACRLKTRRMRVTDGA